MTPRCTTYASSVENITCAARGVAVPGVAVAGARGGRRRVRHRRRPQCSSGHSASSEGTASASVSHSGVAAANKAVQTPECSTETSKMVGSSAGAAGVLDARVLATVHLLFFYLALVCCNIEGFKCHFDYHLTSLGSQMGGSAIYRSNF